MIGVLLFKQKTAYEIKECDWSSDVCSSDLIIKLTTRRNIAVNGSQVSGALFQVLKRQPKTPGTMTLTVMDTKWTKRYGFICAAGYPV